MGFLSNTRARLDATKKTMVGRVTTRTHNRVATPETGLRFIHLVASETIETITLLVACTSRVLIRNPVSRRPTQSTDATTTPEILEVSACRTKPPRKIIPAATRCLLLDMKTSSLALATLTNDKMTTR